MRNLTGLLLYPKAVAELLGVGTTKFHDIKKRPDFPKARNVDGKTPMYLRKEIEDWSNSLPHEM